MSTSNEVVEMIVVFKKIVPIEVASRIMDSLERPYNEGMDSSRGKIYFYKTGPKFRVKITPDEVPEFTEHLGRLSEVYEIYKANWNIVKD